MSNVVEYKDIMAFHPGYYIEELIDDLGISQAELAMRVGTTPKTISRLVNGKENLSHEIAENLSIMLGTSVELWLNLQAEYEKKLAEIRIQQKLDDQVEIARLIDYNYFVLTINLPSTRDITEKVNNLCAFFKIANLRILANEDFLASYRTSIKDVELKNIVNARAWLQTAINVARQQDTKSFDCKRFQAALQEIRKMTLENEDVFLPKLKTLMTDCGVKFVVLPYLKNSGVNGVVKWLDKDHVMLAMNNRRLYADDFWFSFFHEAKHVLQFKHKQIFVSYEDRKEMKNDLEKEADEFSGDFLISESKYKEYISQNCITKASVIDFANSIGVHPGIVVGRLQHDKKLAPNMFNGLRVKYRLV